MALLGFAINMTSSCRFRNLCIWDDPLFRTLALKASLPQDFQQGEEVIPHYVRSYVITKFVQETWCVLLK